jgi:hypothetical protein
MRRVGIGAGVPVGHTMRGMAGRIAAVAVGAGRAARAATMTGLIGVSAAVAVRDGAAAMAGSIGRILVTDLRIGGAGAEDGQSRAPNNSPTGNAAKK